MSQPGRVRLPDGSAVIGSELPNGNGGDDGRLQWRGPSLCAGITQPVPVSEADFRGAVEALKRLLERGGARLLIAPRVLERFSLRFEVRGDQHQVEELLREHDMSLRRFRTATDDVAEVLSAVTQQQPKDSFASMRAENADDGESREIAELKYDLAEEQFDVPTLRRRGGSSAPRTRRCFTTSGGKWAHGPL